MNQPTQSIDDKIIRAITDKKRISVYSAKDFSHLGRPEAVRQALSRLAKTRRLRRIRQGLYDLPKNHPIVGKTAPDPMATIRALMRGSGAKWQPAGAYAANLLGLSEQVPSKVVIITDGVPRRISLGKQVIEFRRAAPRNLLGAGRPSGTVIQAIRHLRKEGVTPKVVARIRGQVDRKTQRELEKLTPNLPAWMQPIVEQISQGKADS